MKNGTDVYALHSVFDSLGVDGHRCHRIGERSTAHSDASWRYQSFPVGGFIVTPFDCRHDVPNIGFYIHSTATEENLLYFTDSFYVRYTFPDLHYIMAEANYSGEAMSGSIHSGRIPVEMKKRLVQSHMSIDNLIELLKANDLSKVKQIHLLHLSDNNSDEAEFKHRVQSETGCEVYVC